MIDISNLTYKELEELEKAIAFRKEDISIAEYTGLVNSVEKSIKALVSAGFGPRIAIRAYCEDCNEETEIPWYSLLSCVESTFRQDY